MKIKIILSALILLSIQAYSQSKNNISLVYGINANDVDIHGIIGDFGYQQKTGTMFGLSYSRDLANHFSLQTGLLYSDNKIQKSTIIAGMGEIQQHGHIKMLTVPLYVNYSFLKYLFANGGLLIDAETNHQDNLNNEIAVNQSGIGAGFGIGAKYSFGNVSVFVNPFAQYHALVKFSGSGLNENLMEKGIKFGVGYNF